MNIKSKIPMLQVLLTFSLCLAALSGCSTQSSGSNGSAKEAKTSQLTSAATLPGTYEDDTHSFSLTIYPDLTAKAIIGSSVTYTGGTIALQPDGSFVFNHETDIVAHFKRIDDNTISYLANTNVVTLAHRVTK